MYLWKDGSSNGKVEGSAFIVTRFLGREQSRTVNSIWTFWLPDEPLVYLGGVPITPQQAVLWGTCLFIFLIKNPVQPVGPACADSELILTIYKAVWPVGNKVNLTWCLTPAFFIVPPHHTFLVTQSSRCMAFSASWELLDGPAAPWEDLGVHKQELLCAGHKIILDCGPQCEGSGIFQI